MASTGLTLIPTGYCNLWIPPYQNLIVRLFLRTYHKKRQVCLQNCGFDSRLKFGPDGSKIVNDEIYAGIIPRSPLTRAAKFELRRREPLIFFQTDRKHYWAMFNKRN